MTAPKLCKDCRHYTAAYFRSIPYIGGVHVPAKCIRSDLITGSGQHAKECAVERTNVDAFSCGPDAQHWDDA